ncbi:DUF488 domain-containing protein [Gorillibacterium sp. CAU 1737]|uniref:DUF488 domain-containing protein n=1 Tax=Gorillibacterium sp. CAU 1737 TaxID=3140362 RepID=UPI00325FEF16
MLQIKRIYEPPFTQDGVRVLVDRLWPRGILKKDACLSDWLKDIAPSPGLRQWFGHQPERFDAFAERYREELTAERQQAALDKLGRMMKEGPVTLLYAARDPVHNHAIVLQRVLQDRRGSKPE